MGVARYWRQQDQRYNLGGSKCTICNREFFPSRTMCPICHRRSLGKMEKYHFKGFGKVTSFTVVHDPAPGYRSQVPYILATIELEEGDLVLGQIVDCPPSEVEIGSDVEMVFRKLSEEGKSGTIQYGYKFRLK
ncbi:MAG: Zn-ribbon domain-containing OB-fold protein [Candidatus Thermoplasmatota archaeon]|nr:Zn-ribbon domain-containing OB-fold protein [Candidatus Thermoplasmatota archaeon]